MTWPCQNSYDEECEINERTINEQKAWKTRFEIKDADDMRGVGNWFTASRIPGRGNPVDFDAMFRDEIQRLRELESSPACSY